MRLNLKTAVSRKSAQIFTVLKSKIKIYIQPLGEHPDFDFRFKFLAARSSRTVGPKISAAVAGNDSDVPAAGKIAGRADWAERNPGRRTAETIFATAEKRRPL